MFRFKAFFYLLHRIVFIILSFCISTVLIAQTDTIMLNKVEITSHKPPDIYPESGRQVTIITRKQIEIAAASSINDVLRNVAGIDIRQRGSSGVQADVSIRGGSFEQTLMLLNGVRINDPQTGHHNLNIPLDPEMIERIEILYGPAATIFGANAFSGAINIITLSPEKKQLKLYSSAGENNLFSLGSSLSFGNEKVSNQMMFSGKTSDGYMENTDFRTLNYFLNSEFSGAYGRIYLQHGLSSRAFGAQAFYTPKYPNQYENLLTTISSVSYSVGKKLQFRQNAWIRTNRDRFELFRSNPPVWYKGHNFHFTRAFGSDFSLAFVSFLGKTSFGGEYRIESIASNVLGEKLDTSIPVNSQDGVFYTHGKQRDLTSLHFNQSFYVNHFVITTGSMIQFIRGLSARNYPGLEIGCQLFPKLRVIGSVNKSLRIPSFTDLYYSGPTNIGNPQLKPEEAISIETGLRYQSGSVMARVSGFKRYGKNLIDWVQRESDSKWVSLNHTNITTSGFETDLLINPTFINPNSFLKKLILNYTFLQLSKQSSELKSWYVMDYLRHKAVLQCEHRLFSGISAFWNFNLSDRQGRYQDFKTGLEVPYNVFLIADLKIMYRYRSAFFYIQANNLFNTPNFDLGNVPLPGRWLIIGSEICFSPKTKSN